MLATLKDKFCLADKLFYQVANHVEGQETIAKAPVYNNGNKETRGETNFILVTSDGDKGRLTFREKNQVVTPGDDAGMGVNKKVQGVPIRSIYSMVRAGPTFKNTFEGRDIIE